jgi:hypothetical protein
VCVYVCVCVCMCVCVCVCVHICWSKEEKFDLTEVNNIHLNFHCFMSAPVFWVVKLQVFCVHLN